MRGPVPKAATALAYLAFLLWIGWAGISDRGSDWSTFSFVLFWLAWASGSVALGAVWANPDVLWLPVLAFVLLISYAGLWPDKIENEIWLLNLAFHAVVSAAMIGLGVAVGRRQTSGRT